MGRAHAPVELHRPRPGKRTTAVRRRPRPRADSRRALARAGPLVGLLLVFQVSHPVHGAYSAQTANGANNLRSAVHYTCNNAVRDIGAGGVVGSAPANRYHKLAETSGPTASGPIRIASGLPEPSTAKWVVIDSPPRERPMP